MSGALPAAAAAVAACSCSSRQAHPTATAEAHRVKGRHREAAGPTGPAAGAAGSPPAQPRSAAAGRTAGPGTAAGGPACRIRERQGAKDVAATHQHRRVHDGGVGVRRGLRLRESVRRCQRRDTRRGDACLRHNVQVLDVASTEDDTVVDLIAGRNLRAAQLAVFGSEGAHCAAERKWGGRGSALYLETLLRAEAGAQRSARATS